MFIVNIPKQGRSKRVKKQFYFKILNNFYIKKTKI